MQKNYRDIITNINTQILIHKHQYRYTMKITSLISLVILLSFPCVAQWETIDTNNSSTARHENGFVAHKDNLYLIGGRGIKPVESFSIKSNTWTKHKPTPIEFHHITPISINNKILLVTGMTGSFPKETPLSHIYEYDTTLDSWKKVFEIPKERRRGGAGVTIYNNKVYIVGGITFGHTSGTNNMVDVYDPTTNTWQTLTNAPHIRDHSSLTAVNGQLIAIGGRNTSYHHKDDFFAFFGAVQKNIDVYDIQKDTWSTLPELLPNPSAGAGVVSFNDTIYFIGGETGALPANNSTYVLNTQNFTWQAKSNLQRGRHGTNAVIFGNTIYIAAGCGNRGGEPELNSIEQYIITE